MDEEQFRAEFSKKSVFRQASSLDLSYVPETLYCRDEIIKELIHTFRRIIDEDQQSSITTLLNGKGGVGKTVTARFFGRNFKKIAIEEGIDLFIEYFNCINFRTKSMILRELLSKYTHGSGRGYSDDEAIKLILTQLVREKGYMLLIIDEIHLLDPKDIWAFLDISETFGHQNAKLSILLISRTRDWIQIETERILSRLNSKIKLAPYDFEESIRILKYRSDIAFKEGVISDNILEMISQIVVEHGNMRHGIEILRKCGLYADKEGLTQITADMVREASNEVYPTFRGEIIDQLSDHELLALYGICQSLLHSNESYTIVDDAYEEYKATCETYSVTSHVKMSFRKYVRQLNTLKIIASKTVRISEDKRGRRLEITLLDIPSKKLIELLDNMFRIKFKDLR
ncbi:MAG: ORC1-type DNA replication protein 1 [Promethearchaeota archaeon]|nr:MAG: ORC1-type DNA replication protein 1 [Candidatus Lokiarchaeota archaeon]